MTNTIVSWTPEVVYTPLLAAHKVALAGTALATKAVTPVRTGRLAASVRALPTTELSGIVGTRLWYARFVAGGAKAHDILPRFGSLTPTGRTRKSGKHALAGPGFGPFAHVHSPGVKATHFVRKGAASYVELFKAAGTVACARAFRKRA